MSEPIFYFFGCLKEPGHFIHARPGFTAQHDAWEQIPWGYELDTGLLPKGQPEIEGQGVLVRKDGWTVVSFWDRTIDKRGACNSALIGKGDLSLEQLLVMFQETFPERYAAIKFQITVVE